MFCSRNKQFLQSPKEQKYVVNLPELVISFKGRGCALQIKKKIRGGNANCLIKSLCCCKRDF